MREESLGEAVAAPESGLPSVGVVIPAGHRPGRLPHALSSVLRQDYQGPLRVVVVYDSPRRPSPGRVRPLIPHREDRPVTVLTNTRTPGLTGARNTGVLALTTDLVAFCDETAEWEPGKLTAQVTALARTPDAELVTCGVAYPSRGGWTPRLAGVNRLRLADLARTRLVRFPSSTFLARREALVAPHRIGLLAEDAPGQRNEDWDLLLRAARRTPPAHVDAPLVRVPPPRPNSTEYATDLSSLRWIMARHPEIRRFPGAARLYGQLACWSAALGNRRDAWHWARQAVRRNWREPRAALALAALSGAVQIQSLLATLNRRGHPL
ncbi:MAG TPA: glycosyltransferase family A protein [Natronosporangium sp.]|nr:glycosyltransferase family A protein [Natronosporangium sp.]